MPTNLQFKLPLPDAPAAALPSDKQRELALALVELLLNAARGIDHHPKREDGHEPKADQ